MSVLMFCRTKLHRQYTIYLGMLTQANLATFLLMTTGLKRARHLAKLMRALSCSPLACVLQDLCTMLTGTSCPPKILDAVASVVSTAESPPPGTYILYKCICNPSIYLYRIYLSLSKASAEPCHKAQGCALTCSIHVSGREARNASLGWKREQAGHLLCANADTICEALRSILGPWTLQVGGTTGVILCEQIHAAHWQTQTQTD
jgi:hypothetical protein